MKKLLSLYKNSPIFLRLFLIASPILFICALGSLYYYKKVYKSKSKYRIASPHTLDSVYFNQIPMTQDVSGIFTSLAIAPDGKLYAASIDGIIKRYLIKQDGTLLFEDSIKPFKNDKKLLIGLCFEQNSSPSSLVAWITYHDFAGLEGAPHWDGRVAKLTFSPNPDSVSTQLVITNLPRSAKDHLTNSLAFGKDGAIYINQGCMTWMGRPCVEGGVKWDEGRNETLLAGTILRLDTGKLPAQLPLDVKTIDGGGSYDPYAPQSPLTIYATGVRNAYDLVWHTNGNLYIAVNGASEGGCTPTSNPQDKNYIPPLKGIKYAGRKDIPAIDNVGNPQEDFLLEIQQGKYYGQPNPIRAEYVMNRGEIDIEDKVCEGIAAEANFFPPAFSFGVHSSPTGTIEYKSDVLGGKLKGMLMVARFNMYGDLALIKIDENTQKITQHYDGAKIGLGNINAPLDVVEDIRTGNLYISQYGTNANIKLFKPSNVKIETIHAQDTKSKMSPQKIVLLTGGNDIAKGKEIYLQSCSVCHGEKGQGLIAPNLTDTYWIHGGDIKAIFKVIQKGVMEKGMQAWENSLTEKQMQQVSSFVLSLQATNPLNPKAAEGKKQ